MGSAQIETAYLLTGPTADVWMFVAFTSGALALFLVGLPLIQRSIRDQVPDTSRPEAWLLTAIPGGFLLILALFPLKTVFLDYPRMIAAYREHQYQVVAGCLDGFDPSPVVGHTADTIRVGGRTFSYADFTITGPGFHQTAAYGGPIRSDTWVRLFLVGDSIVRVDAAQKACPSAPRFAVS
jgi:hypothetical protein